VTNYPGTYQDSPAAVLDSARGARRDTPADVTWLGRVPTGRLWIMWFALRFLAAAREIRPREFSFLGESYVISGWIANIELSIRWATVFTVVLVLSRAASVRMPVEGWRLCLWSLISGLALAFLAITLLSGAPCFLVPWSVCAFDRNWFGTRLLAIGEWTFITVPMILAWVAARIAVLHRADAIRADKLRSLLSRFQAAALTSQVRPHFLFNTLQSVATLMHRDVEAADRMITAIQRLLQRTMDLESSLEVSLRTELALLRQYTEIANIRFGDRFDVVVDVDEAAEEAQVPQLILQPLVENAIDHAFARAGKGSVGIAAWVEVQSSSLIIEVSDNGPGGINSVEEEHFGLGLRTLRTRLEALYGSSQSVVLSPRAGGGTTARIQLPYRSATCA
jgi:two-component system, LytTR family, sensor kinase